MGRERNRGQKVFYMKFFLHVTLSVYYTLDSLYITPYTLCITPYTLCILHLTLSVYYTFHVCMSQLFNISGQVNNPCTVEEEMSIPLKEGLFQVVHPLLSYLRGSSLVVVVLPVDRMLPLFCCLYHRKLGTKATALTLLYFIMEESKSYHKTKFTFIFLSSFALL